MSINHVSALPPVILLLAMVAGGPAIAQSTQVVEDKDVGVRLSIPKNWAWRSRERDIFINCAPDKEDRGRPACYFTVQKHKASPDQKAITDADRAQWKGWTHANGMRPIISTRDFKVAGFPAHEILAKDGTDRSDSRMRRVFVLMPGTGRVLDAWFATILDDKDYDRYEPGFAVALETLAPTK
jgi:hypothetical protein